MDSRRKFGAETIAYPGELFNASFVAIDLVDPFLCLRISSLERVAEGGQPRVELGYA